MLDNFSATFEPAIWARGAQTERMGQARIDGGFLMRLLDEVDYGILALDAQGRIVHANHVARLELASGNALCQRDGRLAACVQGQSAAMEQALGKAGMGQCVLMEMGLADRRLAIAFSPWAHPIDEPRDVVLVICGRRQVCQSSSLHCFAQLHALTGAEEEVLRQVCTGGKPEAVARALGVGLATVRSHIQSIRHKTGAASMPDVIKRMAALPPLAAAPEDGRRHNSWHGTELRSGRRQDRQGHKYRVA